MSTSSTTPTEADSLTQKFSEFFKRYYDQDIKQLAERAPTTGLDVSWADLYTYDPDLADDFLDDPEKLKPYAEEALRLYDLPIDAPLGKANVRVHNLADTHTFLPHGFSPTDRAGTYVAIQGDVKQNTNQYSKMVEAAFECQRCGVLTRIPQNDGSDFQEPHECQGCERQGPFQVNFDQSEFVDAQDLLLQTPPEQQGGGSSDIHVHVEEDLSEIASVGDRITVSGVAHLEQKEGNGKKMNRYDPYLEGHHIELEESDHTDIDVSSEERKQIRAYARGDHGTPLTVAAESYYPEIYGYNTIKKALILAIVGGANETQGIRGVIHVLLLGDPATAKSKLIERAGEVAVRSVAASSANSTAAGLTSTVTRDEFGGGEWVLKAGAFAKANDGLLYIDELDDLDPEDRSSMLEPMSKQKLHVSKADITTTLSTKTAVVAAANPKHGRWDSYQMEIDQFGFQDNLLSRFDLVFTVQDKPDPEEDANIVDHMARARDARKRAQRGEELSDEEHETIEGQVNEDLLRKWLALAKQQSDPAFESTEIRESLRQSFVDLRGVNGYDEDEPVPVSLRKFEAVVRLAEAIAKLEFSEVITERHAKQAMQLVGESMQDYQRDEDGTLDADIQEVGQSKSQRDRKNAVVSEIQSQMSNGDDASAAIEDVVAALSNNYDPGAVRHDIEEFLSNGEAVRDGTESIRYFGKK